MPSETPGMEGGGSAPPSRPWWLAAGIATIGAIWFIEGLRLPQTARYAAIGPGMFVTLVGGGLLLLAALLAVQIARGERFEAQDSEDAAGDARTNPRALAIAIAATLMPILTIQHLGLPITAAISFVLVARALGSPSPLLDLLYGAALGAGAWLMFSRLGLQLGAFLPIAGL